ncbi:hypothetical protein [Mycobacterium phage WXIN]|nr:hypothetical protein [Mycobacterium phage WXIN]
MSKQAIRNRKAMPTRRELRDQITARETVQDMRAGLRSWSEYLMETGRAYQ